MFCAMKYYYEKPNDWIGAGETYLCDHALFNRCTLFRQGNRALIVVQEHYNNKTKARWWGTVDPWLAGDIYFSPGFNEFFEKHAAEQDENGFYPIVPVRKIMWSLRMKPLRKEKWEEDF